MQQLDHDISRLSPQYFLGQRIPADVHSQRVLAYAARLYSRPLMIA
jgi:hypothetical protein